MNIAAYAIALNEAANVPAWAASLHECDQIVLADTGSTDKTVELAEAEGADVHRISVQPWHFGNARNQALSKVPYDVDFCFVVDLDERPEPGWRARFEDQVARMEKPWPSLYQGTRVWGDMRYHRTFLHKRTDCYWRRPVHEELVWTRGIRPTPGYCELVVHHLPDAAKSRSSYLELMALGVQEDPHDTQLAFWYARELMYHRHYEDAIVAFQRFCLLPDSWIVEIAQAHIYIAEMTEMCGQYATAEKNFGTAMELMPWRREPLVAAARFHVRLAEHAQAVYYVRMALHIPAAQKPADYLTDPGAWDDAYLRKEFGFGY